MVSIESIWAFLRHPIEGIARHSSLYKGSIKNYNQVVTGRNELETDYTNLSKKSNVQEETIVRLTSEKLKLAQKGIRCDELDDKYIQCQKDSIEVQERNAHLQRDLEKRTNELGAIKYDVENALETCIYVRTGYDVMEARAEENHSPNSGLEDWIKYQKKPIEERAECAEEEARKLRSSAFRIAVNSVIQNNPLFKKIPFLYYDFVDRELIGDDSAGKIFNIHNKKDFTLRRLLRGILKEDLHGKEGEVGILGSLQKGVGLKHYKAQTVGKEPKDLRLTTVPFKYDGDPVGVGIFLWNPKFSKQTLKDYRASSIVEKVIEEISKEFDDLKKDIRIKQLQGKK